MVDPNIAREEVLKNERRISRKSFLAKQARVQEAQAAAAAAKVAARAAAKTLFLSEGVDNAPFAHQIDDEEKKANPLATFLKWRGYHSKAGAVDKLIFFENGTFTVAKNTKENGFFASGYYFCRSDNGNLSGRINDVIASNSIGHDTFLPKEGDFLEGNFQSSLNKLDPKKISVTFVSGRARGRSRGSSGSM